MGPESYSFFFFAKADLNHYHSRQSAGRPVALELHAEAGKKVRHLLKIHLP